MSDHHKKHEKHHEEPVVVEEVVVEEAEIELVEDEPVEEPVKELKTLPLKGAWTVLRETFETWKKHWRFMTSIQLVWAATFLLTIVVGAVLAGFGIASTGVISGELSAEGIINSITAASGALAIILVAVALMAAIILIISTWMSLATIQAWVWVKKEEHDQMSVRRAYMTTWPLVPGYIWISILAVALVVLGFYGLVIPGLLLAVSFALLTSVALAEKLKGRHAIMRTTHLARPYLLTIFWRILLTAIVLYIPAEIVAGILNSMADGLGDALNQMYGLVVSPIFAGVLYATYLEIKAADRKVTYHAWFSLERMALIGAVISTVILGIALLMGKL